MEIAKVKQYTRETFRERREVPNVKGGVELPYPFQWLLFKPQAHAIAPFDYNWASRNENTQRDNEKR